MKDKEEIEQEEFSDDELIIRKKKTPEQKTGVSAESVVKTAMDALDALRAKKPLVECLANYVGAGFTANALFALGASPMMLEDMGEATNFATQTDGLLINMGTVSKPQTDAMRAAVAHANSAAKPWLLDPAGIGTLPLRTFTTKELMRRFPAIIRGNASEVMFLAGAETAGRGLEAVISSDEAVAGAQRLAGVTRAAVIVAGATDYVAAEGAPVVAVSHVELPRLAGLGCVQGALGAAFLGALGTRSRWEAAVSAVVVMAVAAELALKQAKGPGTFAAAFVDALANVTPADVKKLAKVKVG